MTEPIPAIIAIIICVVIGGLILGLAWSMKRMADVGGKFIIAYEKYLREKMKVDPEELEKINEQMQGWEVDRVESGTGENVFIVHLKKGENERRVILAANDLGGWLGT